MRLIFTRHGETTGDLEDRYGGAYDDGLSDEGFAQAKRMAAELKDKGIQRVITSRLLRARQTGAILGAELGLEPTVGPNFHERDQYGPLSGMEKAEAKMRHPNMVEQLKDYMFTFPGAESYHDFHERIIGAIAHLQDGTAVVWHGGAMRVLFRDILEMGELGHVGDCCWLEIVRNGNRWRVVDSMRIDIGA